MKYLKTFENFNSSNPQEHDVVLLYDGRIGTIVHIYPNVENYIIEIENDTEEINKSQIKEIIE